MNNWSSREWSKCFLSWCFAGLISLLISSAFVLLYNYSGTHIVNTSGATDYKWMPKQYKANMTEGINFMHMDANGFNNLSANADDIDNIAILLMGGSHMEAVQFPTEHNTGSLLNKKFKNYKNYKTYNIGMSGHQLINCLDNLEVASSYYSPSRFVIIQTSQLKLSSSEINSVLTHTLKDIPSYDSGLLYYLQKIPAIKVVYKQLMDKIAIDRASSKKQQLSQQLEQLEQDYCFSDGSLDMLLNKSRKLCKKLIIAYTPQIAILQSGQIERADDLKYVNKFKQCCENNDIIFIDCYNAFLNEYHKSYSVPFGFHNSKMGTGHLNKLGHKILAEELIKTIEEYEEYQL